MNGYLTMTIPPPLGSELQHLHLLIHTSFSGSALESRLIGSRLGHTSCLGDRETSVTYPSVLGLTNSR